MEISYILVKLDIIQINGFSFGCPTLGFKQYSII